VYWKLVFCMFKKIMSSFGSFTSLRQHNKMNFYILQNLFSPVFAWFHAQDESFSSNAFIQYTCLYSMVFRIESHIAAAVTSERNNFIRIVKMCAKSSVFCVWNEWMNGFIDPIDQLEGDVVFVFYLKNMEYEGSIWFS
jgi:hypothetical protein